MVGSTDRAFQLAPEAFNGVGMHVAPDVFFAPVINVLVVISRLLNATVACPFIGHDVGADAYVMPDEGHNGRSLGILYNLGPDMAVSGNSTHHRGFAFKGAPAFSASFLSANIGFIHFHSARKLIGFLAHHGMDLILHSPSTFISNSKVALKLFSGNAVLGLAHKIDGEIPACKGRSGLMKYGVSRRGKLVATVGTAVNLLGANAVKASLLFALGAGISLAVSLLKEIFQAGIFIRKLGFEGLNVVFHSLTITYYLRDVKG